jgi:butyryl-CoA dehydrogenase
MTFDLTPEQAAFRASTEELAAAHVAPVAAAIDQTGEYPRTLIAALAKNGLLGVTIPREWGGAGRDYVSYALALETLARASAVVSVIASVNNSLVAEPLAAFGSDTQKEMWLRRIATGESIGAFALSERQAGSDAANQQTTARLDERGYVIDGHKVWVANGEVADLAIVFAATQPGSRGRGVGAFLVPLDTPGLTCVPTGESLGVRGLGCVDMELRDVRVDAGALLGGVHDGFQIAMWALDGGRVAIAAQALGVGQAALAEAIAHAKSHAAFGQPISNYEAIQWMVADSADGEAGRIGSGAPRRRSCDADPRLSRLPPWLGRRAPVPGRSCNRDLPGHVGSPADGDQRVRDLIQPACARGRAAGRWLQ